MTQDKLQLMQPDFAFYTFIYVDLYNIEYTAASCNISLSHDESHLVMLEDLGHVLTYILLGN